MPSGFDAGTGDQVCRNCGEPTSLSELDQYHWCGECQAGLRKRITGRAHVIALLVVVPFAGWILLDSQFSYFPWYAWLLPLAAAYYLGFRLGREVMKGWIRWQRVNRPE